MLLLQHSQLLKKVYHDKAKAIVLIALIGQIQEETNSDESVETVIVTASKTAKQENISAAVSVISKRKLQEKVFALLLFCQGRSGFTSNKQLRDKEYQ